MSTSRRYGTSVCALLALAAACLTAGGAVAAPPVASFTATDFSWHLTGDTANTVHINPGDTVAFEYPTGVSAHNADFGSLDPTSCTQSTGADSGAVPPLPNSPTAASWSGTCTFDTDGTYMFHCDLHGSMHGTVVVGNGGPSSPTGGGGTGGGSGGGSGGGTGTSSQNSLTGSAVSLTKTQRGTKVRGSVLVAEPWSSLAVTVYARATDLATQSSAKYKRVGRVTKVALDGGRERFSVAISRKARSALADAGKLRLRVTLRLENSAGQRVNGVRSVTLKPRS